MLDGNVARAWLALEAADAAEVAAALEHAAGTFAGVGDAALGMALPQWTVDEAAEQPATPWRYPQE